MLDHSNPSRSVTENPSRKPNNAHIAKHPIHTCTTTTAKNEPSCFARSARQLLTLIIVIKEQLRPNITVHIATARYSAGKSVSKSLYINAATTIVHIESTHSNNSISQNKISDNQNLLNSNSITFTVNIYSKLKNSSYLHHSNPPSTSEKSIIHQTC